MKFTKILFLLTFLFLFQGCDNSDPQLKTPIIHGLSDIEYFMGEDVPNYLEGITAEDYQGEPIDAITVDDEEVDYDLLGTYNVYYSVEDKKGNSVIESIKIFVYDNEKPIISGYNRIYHYIGNENPDYMRLVEAYDNEDGDITNHITINDEMVDLSTPGTYPLYYEVTDSYDHKVEQVVVVQVEENNQNVSVDELNIYYINDTHGSILENDDEMGLARIGNVILDSYETNPYETLFLSGGDLLQGNILSNFYYGASMIDMFNYMNLDVFVVGNHEFDWGLDTITEYFDPNTLGVKAEYPLLAANLFYKDTETRPDFIDAYAIIEKGDLKIGVIGTIGEGLESSIAKSRVKDYEFQSPTFWTEYYTDILINEYQVDAVFAINHGNDSYYNMTMSTNGNIDGIFNGHSHSNVIDILSGIPLMQSSSNARALGYLSYSINENKELSLEDFDNLFTYNETGLQTPHPGLSTLIQSYVSQIEPLLNEAILYASKSYDRSTLTTFMAEVMREAADADIGIHNSGGTRDSLVQGQAITVATTYKIFPFDNQIVSVYIKGSEVISLFNNSSVKYSLKPGLTETDINPESYYWVSTNDYVFGNYDEFQVYDDIYFPNIVDRVAFEDELRERAETTTQFVID